VCASGERFHQTVHTVTNGHHAFPFFFLYFTSPATSYSLYLQHDQTGIQNRFTRGGGSILDNILANRQGNAFYIRYLPKTDNSPESTGREGIDSSPLLIPAWKQTLLHPVCPPWSAEARVASFAAKIILFRRLFFFGSAVRVN